MATLNEKHRKFLEKPFVGTVTTLRADGSPHSTIVWVDNDTNKGLREPLKQFNLPSEPWLFVVDKRGKISSRLEGSIGVKQFEDAVKSGL